MDPDVFNSKIFFCITLLKILQIVQFIQIVQRKSWRSKHDFVYLFWAKSFFIPSIHLYLRFFYNGKLSLYIKPQ